jgi:Anaerobic c4-dicarboxylate membrane transporter
MEPAMYSSSARFNLPVPSRLFGRRSWSRGERLVDTMRLWAELAVLLASIVVGARLGGIGLGGLGLFVFVFLFGLPPRSSPGFARRVAWQGPGYVSS